MRFLSNPFINRQKIFLSKIIKSGSLKEVLLIICLKIIKKIFSRKSSYLKISLILNTILFEFKNRKDELDNDFSELESIRFLNYKEQKRLRDKYNSYNLYKKDLFIQQKISDLNFLLSGPSKEWFKSKNIEFNIALKQRNIFDKKLLGPEWYLNIGHLSLLGCLAIWKSNDFKILEVDNHTIANDELYNLIKTKFEIVKCSHIEYASLILSSPDRFFILGSTEFSNNEYPPKHIFASAFKSNKEILYKTSKFSCLNKIIDKKILQNHEIYPHFVTLHVRGRDIKKENAKSINGRNAFILNYKKAIEFIISQGFNVIRLGDYNSFPLPFINGFIDLTQQKYSKNLDIKLLSNTKFLIGTSSGPINIPPMFGKPVLLTNAVNPRLNFRYPNSFLTPKVWINKNTQKEIAYEDLLRSDLQLIESHSELDEFILRENTCDEILLATKDMINILNNGDNTKELFKATCQNYDKFLSENGIFVDKNDMPLAPSFLKKVINF